MSDKSVNKYFKEIKNISFKNLDTEENSISKSEKMDYEEEKKRLENIRYEEDSAARKELKNKTYRLAVIWLAFIMVIILLQGITIDDDKFGGVFKGLSFNLSDVIMSTLLGGTTVTVTSLLVIVIKGLFKEREK